MDTTWLVSQQALENWLDSLTKQRTLIAPRDVDGILLYRPVADSRQIQWDFTRPVLSVKEIFFPSTERLLKIEKTNQHVNLLENLPEGQKVVYGVRPCDARGLLALDAMFTGHEPVDPYYAKRRAETILVGLACKEMGPTCFCTSVGGAPDDPAGVEVMLYETEAGCLVRAMTEKGQALIPQGWMSTEAELPSPKMDAPVYPLPAHDSWPAHFNADYWEQVAERCLSCRVCAYVCPTCRCFIIRDESLATPGQFERVRCWDSCTGENYRRVAGGHRPRANASERLRNRFYCKFYYYPEQYDLGENVACTGCGRCVEACPVNIDITEVLTDVGRLV
jgi:NAD-dependent dihydropyrimidine dehydrogenase PreA subunit